MDINIKSDGSKRGTTLTIDGMEVKDLRDFGFYLYDWDCDISFNYETREEDKVNNLIITKNYRYDPSCASAKASERPFIVESSEEKANLEFKDFDKM